MLGILYWVFLVLAALLLAYVSPFNLVPIVFLASAAVFFLGYVSFLSRRRRRSGVWEHPRYQVRLYGGAVLYITIFWTTVGLFTNVKDQREFLARYEPNIQQGSQHGYTFYYLDYANCYERIDSPDLNQFLEDKEPGRVHLVLETVKDFGKLRAYSVQSVENIPVNEGWIDGNPPWEVLRQP